MPGRERLRPQDAYPVYLRRPSGCKQDRCRRIQPLAARNIIGPCLLVSPGGQYFATNTPPTESLGQTGEARMPDGPADASAHVVVTYGLRQLLEDRLCRPEVGVQVLLFVCRRGIKRRARQDALP